VSAPDTTEAVTEEVADVICDSVFIDTADWSSVERSEIFHGIATTAIADRKALAEAGCAIVPLDEVAKARAWQEVVAPLRGRSRSVRQTATDDADEAIALTLLGLATEAEVKLVKQRKSLGIADSLSSPPSTHTSDGSPGKANEPVR
jgi:hypothetical protein